MLRSHRIFIAINLPEDIKAALAGCQQKWLDLPAKWTAKENLHITAVFIGDVDDSQLPELHKTIARVSKEHKIFSVSLTSISYGPLKIIPPRMIWANGKKSEEFISLCDNLGRALSALPKILFKPERREIIPHVTLARIKEWEWRRIEPEERPEVAESIDFSFKVKSIELVESILKRTGPEYKILESYKLKDEK